ncbi:glycosyltransferase EpsE [Chryseomicrobium aureum]|uniref:glycosyltransferase family 2 protein n=1 Tax=Chryseomicrobium aureum TaxID=1441723 RepID=UPI001959473C|nr:glycosyltransferase family 2 protein [Chryseomicrobium aureum]MBM7706083.1 glycosyltransferase EpsE [Chryseomicrobium aureum]
MGNKLISVAIATYNSESTIVEALESIINQTYNNFEIIICDDGSTDNTINIIKDYSDKYENIFVYLNETNMGLAFSLNKCIAKSKGEFIARQDADDKSDPMRFQRQYEFLQTHRQYHFVGSWTYTYDDKGVNGVYKFPIEPNMKNLVWGSIFCHGAMLIRKSALEKVNNYTVSNITYRGQDYDLWLKMYANQLLGYNLPEYLYYFRDDENSYKRRKKYKYRIGEARIRLKRYPEIKAPIWAYIICLKPLIAGLTPSFLLQKYHKLVILKNR